MDIHRKIENTPDFYKNQASMWCNVWLLYHVQRKASLPSRRHMMTIEGIYSTSNTNKSFVWEKMNGRLKGNNNSGPNTVREAHHVWHTLQYIPYCRTSFFFSKRKKIGQESEDKVELLWRRLCWCKQYGLVWFMVLIHRLVFTYWMYHTEARIPTQRRY